MNADVIRLKKSDLRFSNLQLFLLIPAWIAAFLISPYLQPLVLISWKHDAAFNDIQQIRAWISRQRVIDPGLEFSDFDQTQLASDFGDLSDPWGNQYQIIERDQISLPNSDATFHAFSFGLDGISKSNGDDPDDINSWDYDRSRYYGAMIRGPRITIQSLANRLGYAYSLLNATVSLLAVSGRHMETPDNKMIDPKSLCCGSWFLVLCSIWVIITVIRLQDMHIEIQYRQPSFVMHPDSLWKPLVGRFHCNQGKLSGLSFRLKN